MNPALSQTPHSPADALIANMFRDDLRMAEQMRIIGKYTLARGHLHAAMEKLGQLEDLTKTKILDSVFTPL